MSEVGGLPIVGIGFHFEDLPVGLKFRTVGRTVTEPDIVNFIGVTGMTEVLFTDLDYVEKESVIKGRLAPGSLAFCFAEGLLMQSTLQRTGLAFLGTELKIERPILAGDTLHVVVEVIAARTTSKPGRGIVTTRNEVVNQKGETVLVYTPTRMIKMRGSAA